MLLSPVSYAVGPHLCHRQVQERGKAMLGLLLVVLIVGALVAAIWGRYSSIKRRYRLPAQIRWYLRPERYR